MAAMKGWTSQYIMCSWLNFSVKVAADIVLSQTLDTTCAGTAGVQYS